MPKLHSHDDPKVDAEFDNLYTMLDRLLVQVSTTEPKSPTSGAQWFNPGTGKLSIYKNTTLGWEAIN